MPKTATPTTTPKNQETQAAPALPMSYDVKIQSLRPGDDSLKGTASVTINGQFAVREISVKDGKNGLFVSMPSYKKGDNEFIDHCFPCTKESRAEFDKAVLNAYEQARFNGTNGQKQEAAEILPLQYDVRVHSLHPGDGALKGTASVSLNDQFAVRRVGIMEGTNGLFVSLPRFQGRNGERKDYCFPCTKEARAEFDKAVLDAYRQTLSQNQEAGQSQKLEAPDPFAGQAPNSAPEMRM